MRWFLIIVCLALGVTLSCPDRTLARSSAARGFGHGRYDRWIPSYRSRGGYRAGRGAFGVNSHPRDRLECGDWSNLSLGVARRSTAAKNAFKRCEPCPSTGLSQGPCPGYVIDHIIALKRGGADDPANMQWQTEEQAKAKDKIE
jgi:hypothetical protein